MFSDDLEWADIYDAAIWPCSNLPIPVAQMPEALDSDSQLPLLIIPSVLTERYDANQQNDCTDYANRAATKNDYHSFPSGDDIVAKPHRTKHHDGSYSASTQ